MSTIQDRLDELGLELPAPRSPMANYPGCKRSGDRQLPFGAAVQLERVLRLAGEGPA